MISSRTRTSLKQGGAMPGPVGAYTAMCELHPLVGKNVHMYVEIQPIIHFRRFSKCSCEAKTLGKAVLCWSLDIWRSSYVLQRSYSTNQWQLNKHSPVTRVRLASDSRMTRERHASDSRATREWLASDYRVTRESVANVRPHHSRVLGRFTRECHWVRTWGTVVKFILIK